VKARIYQFSVAVGAVLATFLAAGQAKAAALFTLPAGLIASTTAYIGDFITSTWELIALAIGLPLAVWVIKVVIGLIPKGRASR
jgi:hypothetical protein